MAADLLIERIASVRAFNRFYTKLIGTLAEGLLDSPYTLAEVRLLFELAQGEETQVAELRRTLGLDAGYLSRLLGRLSGDGLVSRTRAEHDGRQQLLRLTDRGRKVFAELDGRSAAQVEELIGGLDELDRQRLTTAMATIRRLFGDPRARAGRRLGAPHGGASQGGAGQGGDPAAAGGVRLRRARTGDFGWIVQRHGELYAQEYDWDASFEAVVARVVADFVDRGDAEREAAWIAELTGERAGCVLCVRDDDETARLRVLLVEPWARGRGVGGRLVAECLDFARAAGYRRITLTTNGVLHAARRIYQRAGFVPDDRGAGQEHQLVNERWSRTL